MSATLLSDTLNDSDGVLLENHTPVGPTAFSWVLIDGDSLVFDTNTLHKNGTDQPIYVADVDPGTADYQVSLPMHVAATSHQDALGGVRARAATATKAGYYFAVSYVGGDAPRLKLGALDASGNPLFTAADTLFPTDLLGTDVTLVLRVEGSVLTGYVNGVSRLTLTDATYATGKAGLIGGWRQFTTSYAGTPDPIGMAASGASAEGVIYSFDHWERAESRGFQNGVNVGPNLWTGTTSSFPGTFQYIPGSPTGSQPQICTLDRDVGQIVVQVQAANSPGKVEVFDVDDNLLDTAIIVGDSIDTNESHTITASGIRKIKFTPATSGPSDDVTWRCAITDFTLEANLDATLVLLPAFVVTNLVALPDAVPTPFLDRQFNSWADTPTDGGNYAPDQDWTWWDLDITVYEGIEAWTQTNDGEWVNIPITWEGAQRVQTLAGAGDYRNTLVFFGYPFEFRYEMSPFFMKSTKRDGSEVAETRGRLQVRSLKLDYASTKTLTAENTPQSGTTYTKQLSNTTAEDGRLAVPVQTQGEKAAVVFTDSGPNLVRLTGLDWEGYYHTRAKRV